MTLTRYLEGFANPVGDVARSLPPNYAEKLVEINRHLGEPWSLPRAPLPLGPLPEEAREAVREARRVVAERLGQIREDYPPVGRLALTGHAHLDLAWLWPVEETRRKARRTFASVLGLMDRYEDFTFNQSSAQVYRWIEDDAPELFERVRERVAEGRWETVGGAWVEPDCQIPSGESFARQLFYGQRYFEERFGRRSTVAWFPDTFGYSPGIPQLLRGAGLSGFFTYKLNWNETNDFPHDLFVWEGIDGSRVVAHTFENPGTDYNGDVVPLDLHGTWRNFGGKRNHGESLFAFGWGDGGGGPSEKMLENYARLKAFPAMPRLRMARVDDFFDALPGGRAPEVGRRALPGAPPRHPHHPGQGQEAQPRGRAPPARGRGLRDARRRAAARATHPRSWSALWKVVLLNQFHDILPGSSISEVYEDTHRELEEVVATAENLRDRPCGELAGEEPANARDRGQRRPASQAAYRRLAGRRGRHRSHRRRRTSPHPAHRGRAPGPRPGPHGAGPGMDVARGAREHRRTPRQPGDRPRSGASEAGGGTYIENELLRVEIGADGTLHRVYDKEADREVLDGRGNQLWVYADKPAELGRLGRRQGTTRWRGRRSPAPRASRSWKADPCGRRCASSAVSAGPGSRRPTGCSPARDAWTSRRAWSGTSGRCSCGRSSPCGVRSHEATFETMYGVVRRPTHRNTSWDEVRFEVCAHRFADLSEPGYGVALLNDGKYGHSARDNVLGISLLRGPLYPDPLADEGEHRFTYSLFPHPGDWTGAGVTREAFALNSPLVVAEGRGGARRVRVRRGGRRGACARGPQAGGGRAGCDPPPLRAARQSAGSATLRFAFDVGSVERVNLLEEPEGDGRDRGR